MDSKNKRKIKTMNKRVNKKIKPINRILTLLINKQINLKLNKVMLIINKNK